MPPRGKIGDINEVLRSDDELSIEWPIKDFLSLSSSGVDFYVSPEISFCGEDWFLSVWPSGMTWATDDWVDLYLFRKSTGPLRTLDVSLAIRGAEENGKKRTYEFSSKDDGCGWSNFYLRCELQNRKSCLMPDGVLTITCAVKRSLSNLNPFATNDVISCEEAAVQLEASAARIRSSEERYVASNPELTIQTEAISGESRLTESQGPPPNRHGDVIRSMRALLEGGRRSDFNLKMGTKEWRLHKFILESRSPYFADMFRGEWAESAEGEVLADDVIVEEALDNVVRFIYTGEVEDIYVEDLYDLYLAADRYQMDELKPLCVDSMIENMCSEIVCRALAIAKKYGEEGLNEVALDYFVKNAKNIFDTDEYDWLSVKHPEMLADLLEKTARRGSVVSPEERE